MFEFIEYKIGNFPFFNHGIPRHNDFHRINDWGIKQSSAYSPNRHTFE